MGNKKIVYARHADTDNSIVADLNSMRVEFECIDSIYKIFPSLSDPSFVADYVAIDAEELCQNKQNNIFDFIHTLATLISCTVCRLGPGRPQKRNTKIIVTVRRSTKLSTINELLFMPEVDHVIPDFTVKDFDKEEIIKELDNVLEGGKKVTGFIKKFKQRTKKYPKPEQEIQLTPRQSQILNIVTTRGASNKVIAKMLNISESTVKLHLSSIFFSAIALLVQLCGCHYCYPARKLLLPGFHLNNVSNEWLMDH